MKVKAKPEVHDHVLDEYDHAGLVPGKTYTVIGIEVEDYRIVGENGDPVLYPPYLFEVVDPSIAPDWIEKRLAPDEYYATPPEFSERGFWCRYHDRDPEAVARFEEYVAKHTGAD